MAIYIAFHKIYPILTTDTLYIPLQVGKALSDKLLAMAADNTSDHISEKNGTFSELTGLYWIWKNTNDQIVGLCHYRRFFFFKKPHLGMKLKKIGEYLIGLGNKRHGVYYTQKETRSKLILKGDEIIGLLEKNDVIVPVARRMKYSVWEQYKRRHHIRDLEVTRDIVREKYPEFVLAFDQVMRKKELVSGNMFIMKQPHFEEYTHWLFDILFELEKRSDITAYDAYQKRIYGFVSERLLDVWLTQKHLKTYCLPVLYFKRLKS